MKKISLIFLVLITCLSAITAVEAAPGELDPTFGPVGFVTTSLSTGADRAYAIARQSDGKIILAGTQRNANIALVRYNANGTLDTSFDTDGIVITSPGGLSEASAVAIQADGKIVVAGTTGNAGGPYLLIRYNANGSLDTTFDGDGIFMDNSVGTPKALVIQPDGKIVTAGSRTGSNFFSTDYSVVRHNTDGSFDASFDGDGKVLTQASDAAAGGNNFAYAVALQPDGKILVAGEGDFLNTGRDFSLVRYNADGSLDASFDADGKVHTAFGGNGKNETVRALVVQADGRIVAAGFGGEGSVRGFALARYNSDGSLDTTFDGDGRVVTSNAGGNEAVNAAAVQPDGKIIAAGYIGLQIGVIRYNTDGSLDQTFSGDGAALTTVNETGSAMARAVLIEPNGKIVIGGSATIGGSADEDFVFARYNSDGTPSIDLGTFGRVTTNLFGTSSEARDVIVQPDGKIIAAGIRQSVGAETLGVIVRYTADGRIDTTFAVSTSSSGVAGVLVPGASSHELNRIILQPDGKILAVGNYEGQADAGLYIARFNTNGERDYAFGGNNNGFALVSITNGGGLGQDVALQPDGKIIVAGAAVNLSDQTADFAVYRFNADGSRDTTFGTGGAAILSLGGGNDIANSAVVQIDGKIVVAGARNLSEGANGDIALARFNQNGSVDSAFGTNGTVITAVGSFADVATDIQLQSDGKIVAAGVNCADAACAGGKALLLRYNLNGSLDSSFDGDGLVFIQIPGSISSAAASLAIQRDGKIVVAGESVSPVTQSDAFAARYNANGSPDSSFGAGGIVTDDVNNSQQTANAVALQSDGKIVLAGASLNGTRADFTVWRYLGDANTTTRSTQFDYDGDGKADVSVFRPSNGTWYLLNSQTGFSSVQFGVSTDKIAPADFDGDGKTDLAVFRGGNWFLQRSAQGFAAVQFGSAGDVPAPADFDGDGKAELVVFRPSNGYWYVLNLANNQFTAAQFGSSEDKPVTADYDGDGKSDYAVYRPSNGTWYLLQSAKGFSSVQFGIATDKPVVGDYDGDGRADEAVYRPSSGTWYVQQSTKGFASTQFGLSTDLPAAADYDGDGKTDIAVFRPESGNWYQMKSGQGFGFVQFGASADKPTPSAFVSSNP